MILDKRETKIKRERNSHSHGGKKFTKTRPINSVRLQENVKLILPEK